MKTVLSPKSIQVLVVLGAGIATLNLSRSALAQAATKAPDSYPWSETSATVRIPKALLPELSISSVGVK